MRRINKLIATAMMALMMMSAAMAQDLSAQKKSDKYTPQAGPILPVQGSGTQGQLTKWVGFSSSNSFIGDSIITETKAGNIGIGTTSPTSKLTVQGMIEMQLGGLKFPDGTVQTTAGPSPSQVVRSLNGLMGDLMIQAGANITITSSGNTVTITAPNSLSAVAHDATLIGNGTSGMPLGIKLPLNLTAPPGGVGVSATGGTGCTSVVCDGVMAKGGSFGNGVTAIGGPNGGAGVNARGVDAPGVVARGSDISGGFGAAPGVNSQGGNSDFGQGGDGVKGRGGDALGAVGVGGTGGEFIGGIGGKTGGIGVFAEGGRGGTTGGAGLVVRAGDGDPTAPPSQQALAGHFMGGDVNIDGGVLRASAKLFHIDHPLDPENKYLNHVSVESSEVLDIYSGNVTTDESGDAIVTLPDWFEALNKDCRYQLTVIGTFAQAIVADEIKDNRFVIRTSAPNVKVSWQVTGVRSDPATRKRPLVVEEDKPEGERGYYLNPNAYDLPEEKDVNWARYPQLMRQLKEAREKVNKEKQQ